MALSDYERVGKAVQLLAEGIAPFVARECRAKFGDDWTVAVQRKDTRSGGSARKVNPTDPQFLLKVMWDEWHTIFGKKLSRSDRNYVSELQDVRNTWAHNEPFSTDDALRALDTAQRLLESAAASAQANEVGKLHQDLLRQKFEQMPGARRKDAPALPEDQPMLQNPDVSERYGPSVSSLSIPSEADLLYPTVCALRDLGGSGHKTEIDRRVIETEGFSEELMALRRPNGISKVEYRLGWVRTALKGISVVVNTSGGFWSLTEKGLMIDEVKIRSDHANYRRGITQKSKLEPMLQDPGVSERYGPSVSCLSIPSEADLLYPTVCALRDLGGSGRKMELVRNVIENEGYSSSRELVALKRRLGWVLTALKGIDVVVNMSRGYWSLTEKGLMIDEVKIRSDHADYRSRIT